MREGQRWTPEVGLEFLRAHTSWTTRTPLRLNLGSMGLDPLRAELARL